MVFDGIDLIPAHNQILVQLMNIPRTVVVTPFGLLDFLRKP